MKKKSFISVILSAVLLTGCGTAKQSSSDKSAGNDNVIIEPATVVTDLPILTPPVSISSFRCFDRTFDAADSNLICWCNVWHDEHSTRTSYKRKNIPSSELSPEYIAELVSELTSGKYEETNPFNGDYCICLDNAIDGLAIQSGMATVYRYGDLDDLTEESEPAFCLKSGDSCAAYLVPDEMKKEFDELVKSLTVSEENITDTYTIPDHSYRKITETEYKKNTILFVSLYANWAEGIQIHGSFIDDSGYVYKFNFDGIDIEQLCEEREKTDDYTFNEALIDCMYYDVYHKEKPYAKVDSDEIFDIYMERYSISPESEMVRESVGCDMGQQSLYVFDTGNWELVELRTSGDWEGYLDDSAAIDMCNMYDSLEFETIGNTAQRLC